MLQPAHTDHGVATPWDILFLCFAIILYKLYPYYLKQLARTELTY